MQNNPMEIRYTSPATGYVTEVVTASSTQGAINLIKARVPGAKIDGITFLPPR